MVMLPRRSKRDVVELLAFHLVRSPAYAGRLLVYAPRRAWRAIRRLRVRLYDRLAVAGLVGPWAELVEIRPDHPRDERGHLVICGKELKKD
jgi:hypothetical protein